MRLKVNPGTAQLRPLSRQWGKELLVLSISGIDPKRSSRAVREHAFATVAEDQPIAKPTEDICLFRSGGNTETVKSIAIDVEQS